MATLNKYTIIKRITAFVIVCAMCITVFFNYGLIYRANTEDEYVTIIKQNFPESYWEPLIALHEKHPNWKFEPVNTGKDWDKFVYVDEMVISRNLVYASSVLINGKWTKTPTTWQEVEMTGAFNWVNNAWVKFDTGAWHQASKELVAYSVDPRNWLTEDMIFQFQQSSYNASYQTYDLLRKMMENTFMDCDYAIVGGTEQIIYVPAETTQPDTVVGETSLQEETTPQEETSPSEETSPQEPSGEESGTTENPSSSEENSSPDETTPTEPTTEEPSTEPPMIPVVIGKDYATVLIEAAEKYGVSPVMLCTRLMQEKETKYNSATGQYEIGDAMGLGVVADDGKKYYNMFNIMAGGTGDAVIKNGIAHAKKKGWDSQYKALLGGAEFLSSEYINNGQDTLYFQKFNYKTPYKQYMQNITAPVTETRNVYNLYKSLDVLDETFVFRIPVYEDMPETACPMPEIKYGNPNYKLKELKVTGTNMEGAKVDVALTPTFDMDTDTYSAIVPYEVDKINISATAIAGTSTVSGTGVHELKVGENTIEVICKSEFGTTKTYKVNITRKEGGMYLTMLNSSLGNFLEDFDKLKYEYTMIVSNSVENIDIIYTTESLTSYVECVVGDKVIVGNDGTITAIPLAEGLNEILINVYPTAEDKAMCKTYSVYIMKYTQVIFDPLELQFNEETKVLNGFAIGDTVEAALNKFSISNGLATITDADGKVKELTDVIATGDIIAITDANGLDFDKYTILVYGDVNGDSKVNLLDFVIIKNQILRGDRLEGLFLEAADVRPKTVGVDLLDFVGMKNYILKGTEIEQIRQTQTPEEDVETPEEDVEVPDEENVE